MQQRERQNVCTYSLCVCVRSRVVTSRAQVVLTAMYLTSY